MWIYLDSSALIKRVVTEAESPDLVTAVDNYHGHGEALVSSSLAWIEVTRALRNRTESRLAEVADDVDAAMSGVMEQAIQPQIVALARRVSPNALRSLDAIHLASALLIDADVVLTYDDRLARACADNELRVAMPGRAPA